MEGGIVDQFGIGQAVARVYFMSARQAGRTTQMVESVKDGDRIVFTSHREAERVKKLCRAAGTAVECIVVDPKDPSRVFDRPTPKGRTVFDHSWVEQYYMNALEHARKTSSLYGDSHDASKVQRT